MNEFIHSGYFYIASLSPLLLRGAPDYSIETLILCRSSHAKRYRQLRVKDLSKVPTWRLEWDSNLRPSGRKAPNLPMNHHTPHSLLLRIRRFNNVDVGLLVFQNRRPNSA